MTDEAGPSGASDLSSELPARLAAVRGRISAAGGAAQAVQILAVTKGFGVDAVRAALGVGLDQVGENYAQELITKSAELAAAPMPDATPAFHFIGRLQRNKVRTLAGLVAVWQSVDRAELATEIARRAPGARILVQLNLSGEPQKGGCELDGVEALVDHSRDLGLDVAGLMGVGPAGPPIAARPGFAALVALADRLGLAQRSIGMSGDLEVAVGEGSTMVRIGQDLFGPRPARSPA